LVDHLAVRLPQIPPPSMKASGIAPVAMSRRRDAPMPPGTWRPPDHDGARGEGRARRGWVSSRIAVGRAGSGPGRRTTEPPRDHRMSILIVHRRRAPGPEAAPLPGRARGMTAGSRTPGIPGCRSVSCRTRTIASRWRSKLGPALRVRPRRGGPQSGESRRGPDDHVAAETRFTFDAPSAPLQGFVAIPVASPGGLVERGTRSIGPGRSNRVRPRGSTSWAVAGSGESGRIAPSDTSWPFRSGRIPEKSSRLSESRGHVARGLSRKVGPGVAGGVAGWGQRLMISGPSARRKSWPGRGPLPVAAS
jgi:hypothetical protein